MAGLCICSYRSQCVFGDLVQLKALCVLYAISFAGVAPEKLKRTPSLSGLDELIMGRDSDAQQQCFVFMLKVLPQHSKQAWGDLYTCRDIMAN